MSALDAYKIRQDFAILDQVVNDEPLVYLDNAATTQKPQVVLATLMAYYREENANVHRGVHTLAERATAAYEASREKIRQFISAKSTKEILFTRGTTTGLNWVGRFAEQVLEPGDEVVISIMEHHSNIIPWQEACKKAGAKLVYAYLKDGQLDMEDLANKISEKTKFVSLAHVSNGLGCINPVKEIAQMAHRVGAYMVVDGAQSAPHMAIDVQDLDCEFFILSGHKMLAPMGIGALYGKKELLDKMPPFLSGGEMIEIVHWDRVKYAEVPHKFEAGTVNTGGAVGLHAAIDYINNVGFNTIMAQERKLTKIAVDAINDMKGVNLIGSSKAEDHEGIVTFTIDGVHPHDVASILDSQHIAVRAGHHCAQPLMDFLKVNSTTRASFAFYNTEEEVQHFIEELSKIRGLMGYGD